MTELNTALASIGRSFSFFKVRNGMILKLRPFHWDTAAMLPAMRKLS